MDIDVGFWLTLALLITVLIWLADRALKLRQPQRRSKVRDYILGLDS